MMNQCKFLINLYVVKVTEPWSEHRATQRNRPLGAGAGDRLAVVTS